jgi:hypothetical protein
MAQPDGAAQTGRRPKTGRAGAGIIAGPIQPGRPEMQRLFWLASYPRSGNTWLRYLLANAFLGAFERSAEVARLIPDLEAGDIDTATLPDPVAFIKTHRQFLDDLPMRGSSAGVIYLIRNPVNVMQSALRYAVLTGAFRPGAMRKISYGAAVRAWVGTYLENGGALLWQRTGYGSWRSNVASWAIDPLPFPRLVLRYEDVVADTEAALTQIAEFIGSEAAPDRIRQAIAVSTIARLAALESGQDRAGEAGLFASASADRKRRLGLRFVNSADAPGAARLALSAAETEAARRAFADLMERFGYA